MAALGSQSTGPVPFEGREPRVLAQSHEQQALVSHNGLYPGIREYTVLCPSQRQSLSANRRQDVNS